jgi:tRNA threonylcarbamoyladenosine biosynthesis protein TsaB
MDQALMAIESSGVHASVAVWGCDATLLWQGAWTSERHHSAMIFKSLKLALEVLNGQSLGTIVVGAGPGSYGGVRVALAAADGLALYHGAHVVSLCSWEAMPTEEENFRVISNARRNGWAVGRFEHHRLQGDFEIIDTERIQEQLPVWMAAGETVLSVEPEQVIRDAGLEGVKAEIAPQAVLLGEAWLKLSDEEQAKIRAKEPAPIYVRPPHVTLAKRAPWQRGASLS